MFVYFYVGAKRLGLPSIFDNKVLVGLGLPYILTCFDLCLKRQQKEEANYSRSSKQSPLKYIFIFTNIMGASSSDRK
jgi:hypothetical protein